MDAASRVAEGAMTFYQKIKENANGRYHSWEHCYNAFSNARTAEIVDYDSMSLHLAFYLASWGMYRGSSFLLQRDYKIHTPIVQLLLEQKYDILQGIKCQELVKDINYALLDELNGRIEAYYTPIHDEIITTKNPRGTSDTLVTKILMGTLGCVPAYDRFFIAGVKSTKVSTGKYNFSSLSRLANFYKENSEILEKTRSKMKVYGRNYPQMKVLDMGFWQIGIEEQ